MVPVETTLRRFTLPPPEQAVMVRTVHKAMRKFPDNSALILLVRLFFLGSYSRPRTITHGNGVTNS